MTESIVPEPEKPRVGVEASFVEDVKSIIEDGVVEACASVQRAALLTYWRVGRRIVEEEQGGSARAEYGAHLIEGLAKELFPVYGTRYSERRLREFRRFYLQLPDFGIWHSRVPNLTWTHVRQVLPEENADARRWYLREASRETWDVRTLARNLERRREQNGKQAEQRNGNRQGQPGHHRDNRDAEHGKRGCRMRMKHWILGAAAAVAGIVAWGAAAGARGDGPAETWRKLGEIVVPKVEFVNAAPGDVLEYVCGMVAYATGEEEPEFEVEWADAGAALPPVTLTLERASLRDVLRAVDEALGVHTELKADGSGWVVRRVVRPEDCVVVPPSGGVEGEE